jgi:hypothetical protein
VPAEACAATFRWIAWYDRFRLHSTNGYLSPIEWEQKHASHQPTTIDYGRIAPVSTCWGTPIRWTGGGHELASIAIVGLLTYHR